MSSNVEYHDFEHQKYDECIKSYFEKSEKLKSHVLNPVHAPFSDQYKPVELKSVAQYTVHVLKPEKTGQQHCQGRRDMNLVRRLFTRGRFYTIHFCASTLPCLHAYWISMPNSPYIPQPRFSPRDNRQRFPGTPYPRASPRFHQPWSSKPQHSPSTQNQWSQQSPNQEFYNLSQESHSPDSNVLDKGYIPLNLSGNSNGDGSPLNQGSSPRPYGDYNYHHRPNFRGSYNNRRPWSGGPRRNNFHDHKKNWSPRENNYSPNRGAFMQTVDIKQYISAEFLKDPWKHLSKKDSSNSKSLAS